MYRSIRYLPRFIHNYLLYKKMNRKQKRGRGGGEGGGGKPNNERHTKVNINPRFDWDKEAGTASGIYFHQDLWASKKVFAAGPEFHVDVGSRIDGFIAHLLTFTSVKYVDIRPLSSSLPDLEFIQSDATELNFLEDNSVESLSSLNVAEHFGLGRYGDPIDPQGSAKFMKTLQRVIADNGRLYFSVPIGMERVEFNAHRVFEPVSVVNEFDKLELLSFSAVVDGDLVESVEPEDVELKSRGYDCGLYEFGKCG